MRIEPLRGLTGIEALAAQARSEGFRFLDRLIEEWTDGANRFEAPGETLLGVFADGELVATGGLTRQREGLGRVRRVYVHPAHRRRGIATALMSELVARSEFPVLALYTETPGAARLYERLAFLPESPDGPDHATHRLCLKGPSA